MDSEEYKPLRYLSRWFCYFDLLGFRDLVRSDAVDRVIPLYQDVLRILEQQVASKRALGISSSWFSDTFIIFSRGDTVREFPLVEQAGRLFFQKLILGGIPVRGALTFGKLYSQLERNVFIGEALIDAYEYGECQDWLGFLLTPRVYEILKGSSIDLDYRIHYRQVHKPGIIKHSNPDHVYAFAFNNSLRNGRNPYLVSVQRMKTLAGPKHKGKYVNTEEFIRAHNSDLVARASA